MNWATSLKRWAFSGLSAIRVWCAFRQVRASSTGLAGAPWDGGSNLYARDKTVFGRVMAFARTFFCGRIGMAGPEYDMNPVCPLTSLPLCFAAKAELRSELLGAWRAVQAAGKAALPN